MSNIKISQLPEFSGDPNGIYLVMNNSTDTTTYKVKREQIILNGTSGTSGAAGSSGTSGAAGSSGTSGGQGVQGPQGANGANGSSGTSGVSGLGLPSKVIKLDGVWQSVTTTPYKTIVFDTPFSNNDYVVDVIFTFPSYFSNNNIIDDSDRGAFGLSISNKTTTGYTITANDGWGGNINLSSYTDFSGYTTAIQTGSSNGSGINGTSGTSGTQGAQGPQGVDGQRGASGSSGTSGISGQAGQNGAAGSSGTSGTSGAQGPQGTTGQLGASGSSGTSGGQGVPGQQGSQGPQGITGAGFSYQGAFSMVVSYTINQLVTYNGSTYIALGTTLGNLPTNPTYWSLFSAQGAQGAQGTTGQNGASGSSGTSGANGGVGQAGANGSSGTSGTSGVSGSSGTSGSSGAQGATGQQGASGSSGTSGANGASIQGATGAQGPAGSNGGVGSQGAQGYTGQQGSGGSQGPQGPAGSSSQYIINNNTDNNVLTATGGSALNGEPGLTYNGSTLTVSGGITATGNITAYYSSDRRQKDNITPITSALDKVKQLSGVLWDWNENADEVTKQLPNTGLIAQDVKEVLPQVVIERQDGYLALDYSKMIGLLVEAIKELEEKINK